jgi:hypothetical protein
MADDERQKWTQSANFFMSLMRTGLGMALRSSVKNPPPPLRSGSRIPLSVTPRSLVGSIRRAIGFAQGGETIFERDRSADLDRKRVAALVQARVRRRAFHEAEDRLPLVRRERVVRGIGAHEAVDLGAMRAVHYFVARAASREQRLELEVVLEAPIDARELGQREVAVCGRRGWVEIPRRGADQLVDDALSLIPLIHELEGARAELNAVVLVEQ